MNEWEEEKRVKAEKKERREKKGGREGVEEEGKFFLSAFSLFSFRSSLLCRVQHSNLFPRCTLGLDYVVCPGCCILRCPLEHNLLSTVRERNG